MFYLDYELLTTYFIEQARELSMLPLPMMKQLGLRVVDLPGELVRDMDSLVSRYLGPSREDISALLLARHLKCPLVTRDGPLERACRAEQVAVRSTLWLLRKIVLAGIVSETDAADALELINTKRVRPPNQDWTTQVRKWRKHT